MPAFCQETKRPDVSKSSSRIMVITNHRASLCRRKQTHEVNVKLPIQLTQIHELNYSLSFEPKVTELKARQRSEVSVAFKSFTSHLCTAISLKHTYPMEKSILGTQYQSKYSGHGMQISCQLYALKPTVCQLWETDDICIGIKLE